MARGLRTLPALAPFLVAMALAPAAESPGWAGEGSTGVLREEREVAVDGAHEIWRLEWMGTPAAACTPDGDPDGWATCPCAGFELGESGVLHLVRRRPGVAEERLDLTPLFADYETPAPGATLRRYPLQEGDDERAGKSGFPGLVKARPLVSILELDDYDHDGKATELVLQVGSGPCGHRQCLVVGIDGDDPRLHAFTSAESAGKPLVLERPQDWERVREGAARAVVVRGPRERGGVEPDGVGGRRRIARGRRHEAVSHHGARRGTSPRPTALARPRRRRRRTPSRTE